MKKRLLCLFLCLVLVLTAILTGCTNKDEEESADVDEDIGAQTITMRLISEKKVCNTDEELAAYLENECGGDENSEKYKAMLDTKTVYDSVEAEFTKMTKSMYKINVDLIFYTEDEYFDSIEATMDEFIREEQRAQLAMRTLEKYIADYKAAFPEEIFKDEQLTNEFYKYFPEYEQYRGYVVDDELSAFEEQYKENELGIKELVYPETQPNQLDIIYISGYDMYSTYVENEWITALDEQISTTGRKLNDYISSALLNGVKIDGSTYAIPNNIEIGEYTYMLINKELFDSFYYNYEEIDNLLDCKNFLSDVMESDPSVLPIDASFEECMSQFVWYWNIDWVEDEFGDFTYSVGDSNKFSVLGTVLGDPAKAGRGSLELAFTSLFADEAYRDIFLTLKEYEWNNYYVQENDERSNAAISFVNGNYSIKKEALENQGVYTDENGKEYYTVVVRYPEADESSLYGNMYAISSNSKNALGCMQILTLLNTNSELRNILQYGVKNLDYVIDEDTGAIRRIDHIDRTTKRNLGKVYKMDIERTGNCFIAHPEEGLPANYWENSKKQNNEALINPLLGFDFNRELAEFDAKLDEYLMTNVNTLTEQTLKKINDCDSFAELYELVEAEEVGFNYTLVPANNPTIILPGIPDPVGVNLNKMTNKAYDTATGGGVDASGAPLADTYGESPYTIYYTWLTNYGFVPAQ